MEMAIVYKLIALSVVFGLVVASRQATFSDYQNLAYGSPYVAAQARTYDVISHDLPLPSAVSHIVTSICSLFGIKSSVLSLAASGIHWLISNSVTIILGSIASLGFCKLTGKCNVVNDDILPVRAFHEMVTPQRLRIAEDLVVQAVQKYAENRKKRVASS